MAQQAETARLAYNEKQWRKLKSRPYYYKQSADFPHEWEQHKTSELPKHWGNEDAGTDYRADEEGKQYFNILRDPNFGNDDARRTGNVGSSTEQQQSMLSKWCGIDDFRAGEGSVGGIGSDLAEGNTVLAGVDVEVLKNQRDSPSDHPAGHIVTVSKMKWDKDGNLETVTVNNTATGGGCGQEVPGDTFRRASLPHVPTTVVPPGSAFGGHS